MGRRQFTDLDNPETTIKRRNFIAKKPFMHQIYTEWYHMLDQNLPQSKEVVIELGSGPGFIDKVIPGVISTDILYLPFVDLTMNGLYIPFKDGKADSVVMMNVFHHIPDIHKFLSEVARVLRVGGRLIMIEPWVTNWSNWIYTRFHHEITDKDMDDWVFRSSGPLSGANQALPWIVFERDVQIFKQRYQNLSIRKKQIFMPLAYLLGGGFSLRAALPGFLYPLVRKIEQNQMQSEKTGMFALLAIEKTK